MTTAATIHVPADYDSIQAAIDAASPGDTILVNSNTYRENVDVNKALTLTGIDTGGGLPAVDGNGSNAITVSAPDVVVRGFNATNATGTGKNGIYVNAGNVTVEDCIAHGNRNGIGVDVDNSTIANCNASNNNYGIYVKSCSNTIFNNTANNSQYGVWVHIGQHDNNLTGNMVSHNANDGIYVDTGSYNNTLAGNTADHNNNGIYITVLTHENILARNTANNNENGIVLWNSSNNNLTGNTVTHNSVGFILRTSANNNDLARNTVNNNGVGFQIEDSSMNNNLTGNTVTHNTFGFSLYTFAYYNYLAMNIVSDNSYGFDIAYSSDNHLTGNTIMNNGNGILMMAASHNVIWLNNFSNPVDVYLADLAQNQWNSTSPLDYTYNGHTFNNYTGNYWNWSHYAVPDANNDGICDHQYQITGNNVDPSNIDHYPMLYSQPEPMAGFTSDATAGHIPLSIQFMDTSMGVPGSYQWDFGDGTANGTTQNPVHTYRTAGTYDVSLTFSNSNGTDSIQKIGYIIALPSPPVASFSSNVTDGRMPMDVQFNDTSINTPTAWQWDFGDGSANGTTQNATHTYTVRGLYAVTLTASNPEGSDSIRKTGYVYVDWLHPVLNTRTLVTYDAIQAAIDDALPGDHIVANSSTYDENVVVNKTVTLTGVDTGRGMPVVNATGGEAFHISAGDAVVRGFRITGAYLGAGVTGNHVTFADNVIGPGSYGIHIRSSGNTIINNTVNDSIDGISLELGSNNNKLTLNRINRNTWGIQILSSSNDNILTLNMVKDNYLGLYVETSSGNGAWLNSFANNNINAQVNIADSGYWNSTTELDYWYGGARHRNYTGNYWGGYTGPDATGDGIGDEPVTLDDANVDYYPMLGAPVPVVAGVSPNSGSTAGGTPVTITGSCLTGADAVLFGGTPAAGFTVVSDTQVDATSPAGTGTVDVTVATPIGTSAVHSADQFTYVPAPVAGFTANVTGGIAPLTVQFNDTSPGAVDTWNWSFGDGTGNVTTRNATHTFTDGGDYQVDLTVTNSVGSSTASKTVTVLAFGPVKNLRTGRTYLSIQAAIDDANTVIGDTILVNSSTYDENVVVNKTLTLRGNDTGDGLPVVDGNGNTAISVSSNNVVVRGFNVIGATGFYHAGIGVTGNNATLADNTATGNTFGIYLYESDYSTLINNTANDNQRGIYLDYYADHNSLTKNTANYNDVGIAMTLSNYNNMTGNTANFNTVYYGIGFQGCDNNDLTGNTLNNNRMGINLLTSNNNRLTGNVIRDNTEYGFYVTGTSSGNVIWLNNISDSPNNALSHAGMNSWNSTVMMDYVYNGETFHNYTGNFWSDYGGPDVNLDGIGDVPYKIYYGFNSSSQLPEYKDNPDYYPMLLTEPALPLLQLNLTSYSVNENDGSVTLRVNRTGYVAPAVSVVYTVAAGTATDGFNYQAPTPNPDTLVIPAFATDGEITVPILDDGLYGLPKTFTVTLSSPSGATLGANTSATVTIADQDPAPELFFASPAYEVTEGAGTVTITVTRVNDASTNTAVEYNTTDGTAREGVNYVNTSGLLMFNSGVMSQSFTVPILDDSVTDGDLTFNILLAKVYSSPSGAIIGTPGETVVTIRDNDVPVVPVADFDGDVLSGVAPLTVHFSSLSTGNPTLCEWNFGDGSSNISGFAVTHTYFSAGLYAVTMTASNGNGSDTMQKIDYINVSSAPVTSFTIPLKQGWNLISLPLVNYSISASSLGSLGVSEVAWYNDSVGGYDTYLVGLTPDDFNLRPDRGYFLYCDHDTSLVVYGDEPSGRSASLCSGWNMVGWSTLSLSDASEIVSGLAGDQEIARYNTTTQGYDTFIEGLTPDAFTVGPGGGYFIYSDNPATLDYGGF